MAERIEAPDVGDFPGSKELRSYFFQSLRWEFNRCLSPDGRCENHAIRSHSIQNAKVLDLLSRDGHVKMIKQEAKRDALTIDFRDIGRNEATTFAGFCALHDTDVFRPIDVKPIDTNDAEQLFLLAYRSIAQELHASSQAACITQSMYQERVKRGIDKGNEPGPAGVMAVERMMIAYETYQYKLALDEALLAGDHSQLHHTKFLLDHEQPSFAVSAFFDLQQQSGESDSPRIAINVFPISQQQSFVLFSYTSQDAVRARDYLSELGAASGYYQKYLLSKLVLMHCENFVVSPQAFDTWSNEKKNSICKFFHDTVLCDKFVEDSNLYLFD